MTRVEHYTDARHWRKFWPPLIILRDPEMSLSTPLAISPTPTPPLSRPPTRQMLEEEGPFYTLISIEEGDDSSSNEEDEGGIERLRMRVRVLEALCGLEKDAEIEEAATLLQRTARKRATLAARRRTRASKRRWVALTRTAILHSVARRRCFERWERLARRDLRRNRAATRIQSAWRARRVRVRPEVRLLRRFLNEQGRISELELTVLFLQRYYRR